MIFALWLALIAYWGLAATGLRRTVGGRWVWWREIAVRLAFFALVVAAIQVAIMCHPLPGAGLYAGNTSLATGVAGFALCAAGIALAISGRACLERSRAAASAQGDPGLITTGPYALVRHPIYSGLLLALIGSAIGQSVLWLLPLVVYAPRFISSAHHEEQLLSEQFPERYPAYRKRTRMLLPYLW
ncbi:MAG: isoprenylcysteine carboxylmethyltransferase family protein [Gammaproteobacteria bacterium]|nr:isoprenylcysteine carboxylmethyltransferase family protein [Gammaproteobacteria bacterium]